MKTFVIIFVLCFVNGLLAGIINMDDRHLIFLKCAADNHVDNLLLNASFYQNPDLFKDANLINERDLTCFIACTYKHMGMITAEGTLIITSATQNNVPKSWLEFLSKCNEEAKGDTCNLVGCLIRTRENKTYELNDEAKTCFTEHGFDERCAEYTLKKILGQNVVELSKALNDLPSPPKSKLNCSYACAMIKLGIISEKGEVLVSEEHRNIMNISLETINSCTKQAAGDVCKLPVCLFKLQF